MTKVAVGKPDAAMSDLDGITTSAFTGQDALSALQIAIATAESRGAYVLLAAAYVFHGDTPGYLLLTYDKSKDPRAK